MLLRNRSRAVRKAGLMGDHSSHRQNHATPIPSVFGCRKVRELSTKCVFGCGLEGFCSLRSRSRPFKNLLSLYTVGFWHKPQAIPMSSPSPNNTHYSKGGIGIGIALLDNPNVLFGTQLLRVKIPNSSASSKEYSCQTTCVDDWSEMESPTTTTTTTHIFHNFIVVDTMSHHHNNTYSSFPLYSQYSTNFLTLCYTCNMHLDHSKDIFIYRGDKAFCSEECRYTEMVLDTEQETSDFHNIHPHPSLSHMDHKSRIFRVQTL